MGKLDEVSEAIGEVRSDVKNIAKNISKIEKHLKCQNSRISKLEHFKWHVTGGAAAFILLINIVVNYYL